MNASQNALELIKQQEGCILHTYKDSAGIPTTGYGSTMLKDGSKPQMGQTITQAEAEDLLQWEIKNKTSALTGLLKGCYVNQNQYDALTSFVFNCGVGALESSTLLKKVRLNPTDPSIRDEFMKWNKITVNGKHQVLDTLTHRRKIEADLYFKSTN